MDFLILLIKWLFLLTLIITGILSNSVGLIVFSLKSLAKFPSRNIYRAIAGIDLIYLIYSLFRKISQNINFKFYLFSETICKFYKFFNYSTSSITAWLLVYLSIDKFITFKYPKIKITRTDWFQPLVIIVIIAFNFIYFIPIIFYSDLQELGNNTVMNFTSYFECNIIEKRLIINLMELFIMVFLPFILMVTFSVLLSNFILKSRLKILRLNRPQDRKRLRKDVKLAVTSIFFNIVFIFVTFPVCILEFFNEMPSSLIYYITVDVFFINYCSNFVILFFFNSIYRKHVSLLFKLKTK